MIDFFPNHYRLLREKKNALTANNPEVAERMAASPASTGSLIQRQRTQASKDTLEQSAEKHMRYKTPWSAYGDFKFI